MNKSEVLEKVKSLGLLAVIRGPSAELTVQMVEALVKGGVTGIEITYSTPNAEEVVKTLSGKFGDSILLGMGTLTKPEQAASRQSCRRAFPGEPDLRSGTGESHGGQRFGDDGRRADTDRSIPGIQPGRGCGQSIPGIAGWTSLYQSPQRTLPLYSHDADRRGECNQCQRLVRCRGGGGWGRQ